MKQFDPLHLQSIKTCIKKHDERLIVTALTLIFTFLNSLQVIIQWVSNPPGYYFTAITHYFADYFLYTYQMAEGAEGKILTNFLFTNEPQRTTWLYWQNATIGFLGHLVGLDPFGSYNISLMLLVVTLITMWHILLTKIFPLSKTKRLLSLFIILTASPFISLENLFYHGVIRFPDKLWFSPTPSFWRLGGVPHQVFQSIIIILFIISFAKLLEKQNVRTYSTQILLTIIITSAYPMQAMALLIGAGILSLWQTLRHNNLRLLIPITITGIISLPVAYITSVELSLAPFAAAKTWELYQQVPREFSHFFQSHGPIMLFIPFGLYRYFYKANTTAKTFALYALSAIGLYYSPLPSLIGASPIRFFHPISHGFLSVVAAIGIIEIPQLVLNIPFLHTLRFLKTLALLSAFSIYLLHTIPANYKQISNRITPFENYWLLMDTQYNHVPNDFIDAFAWLKNQNEPENKKVVLSDDVLRVEILIPVFTEKISFLGHPLHTLYPDVKESLRNRFFTNAMSEDEIQSFFPNHRIGYIITSPTNSRVPTTAMKYVTIGYENEKIRIYKLMD